jgi:transcriptional regulator with XRE-family HTH domain
MNPEGKVFEARLDVPSQGDEHIGARLREIRKLAGLTQADLAARLKIDQSALSRVEGRKDILVSTLREYLAALGASLQIDARFSDPAALVTCMREAAFHFHSGHESQLLLPIIGEAGHSLRRDVVFSIKPEYCEAIIRAEKPSSCAAGFP